jgi:hypothetical protein
VAVVTAAAGLVAGLVDGDAGVVEPAGDVGAVAPPEDGVWAGGLLLAVPDACEECPVSLETRKKAPPPTASKTTTTSVMRIADWFRPSGGVLIVPGTCGGVRYGACP